jgi:hypothetical protein
MNFTQEVEPEFIPIAVKNISAIHCPPRKLRLS